MKRWAREWTSGEYDDDVIWTVVIVFGFVFVVPNAVLPMWLTLSENSKIADVRQSVRRCRQRTTVRRYGSADGGGAGEEEGGVLRPAALRCRRRCTIQGQSSFWACWHWSRSSWVTLMPPQGRKLRSRPRPAARPAGRKRPSRWSRKSLPSNSNGSSTRRTLLPCIGVSVLPPV